MKFEIFKRLPIWNFAKVGIKGIKIHFHFTTDSFIKQMQNKTRLSNYVNDSSYKRSDKNKLLQHWTLVVTFINIYFNYWAWQNWAWILPLTFSTCVTLSTILTPSCFHQLKKKDRAYLKTLTELNEACIKC